jgi:hypothetical protein
MSNTDKQGHWTADKAGGPWKTGAPFPHKTTNPYTSTPAGHSQPVKRPLAPRPSSHTERAGV